MPFIVLVSNCYMLCDKLVNAILDTSSCSFNHHILLLSRYMSRL